MRRALLRRIARVPALRVGPRPCTARCLPAPTQLQHVEAQPQQSDRDAGAAFACTWSSTAPRCRRRRHRWLRCERPKGSSARPLRRRPCFLTTTLFLRASLSRLPSSDLSHRTSCFCFYCTLHHTHLSRHPRHCPSLSLLRLLACASSPGLFRNAAHASHTSPSSFDLKHLLLLPPKPHSFSTSRRRQRARVATQLGPSQSGEYGPYRIAHRSASQLTSYPQ
jgi:hypothetical protein